MTEYWVISAPGDKTCQQTWDTLNNATKSGSLSVNYKFPIPDLKVGTLDQLVGLSDDLGKLDTFVEGVTRKVAQYLGEVLEDQRDKLHENLMANNELVANDYQTQAPKRQIHSTLLDQIFNITKTKLKLAAQSANQPTPLPNPGIDSYADPGGGEPPSTPASPVCDSAYSEHHGCWPCEHREHSECEASQPSQPSSGRSSPRWDDDDEEDRTHHILSQGSGGIPQPVIPSPI